MKATKLVGIVSIIAGIVLAIAGIGTYAMVSAQLADENITVPGDSAMFAGAQVKGPLTAFAQADTINKHALAGSDGKTYAELGALATQAAEEGNDELAQEYRDQRVTLMNASFLRASLFTSVVAFGVAALVIGLGVMFALIGWALLAVSKRDADPATV